MESQEYSQIMGFDLQVCESGILSKTLACIVREMDSWRAFITKRGMSSAHHADPRISCSCFGTVKSTYLLCISLRKEMHLLHKGYLGRKRRAYRNVWLSPSTLRTTNSSHANITPYSGVLF